MLENAKKNPIAPPTIDSVKEVLSKYVKEANWKAIGRHLKCSASILCPYHWLFDEMKRVIDFDIALQLCVDYNLHPNWLYTAHHGMTPYVSNQVYWLNRLSRDCPDWLEKHSSWLTTCIILNLEKSEKIRLLMGVDYALTLIEDNERREKVFANFFCPHIEVCCESVDWAEFLKQKWLLNGPSGTVTWLTSVLNDKQIAAVGEKIITNLPHRHAPKEDVTRFIVGLFELKHVACFMTPACLSKEHVFKVLVSGRETPHASDFIRFVLSIMSDHIFLKDEASDPIWCLMVLYLWADIGPRKTLSVLRSVCQCHSKNINTLLRGALSTLLSKARSDKNEDRRVTTIIMSRLSNSDDIIVAALRGESEDFKLIDRLIAEDKSDIIPRGVMLNFIKASPKIRLSAKTLRWLRNIYQDKSNSLHPVVVESIDGCVDGLKGNTKLSKADLLLLTKLDRKEMDRIEIERAKIAMFIMLALDMQAKYSNLLQLNSREDVAGVVKSVGISPYELLYYADDPVQRDGVIMAL